jgi:twitching motility protein PilT
MQRGSVGAALRIIPSAIPSFEALNLPPTLREIASRSSGLVLVTGPTGCGKSTTLATMIAHINATRDGHIVTIEDPIEYLHEHGKSMVNQREVGSDTYEFAAALRSVLREDPDVVLVGEMRDLDTISTALTIAETGHLVLGTLHTRNAPQSIDRIVDVFPPYQQEQIRVLLASTLEAIIAQQLLPKFTGLGRVPAVEVLIVNAAVRNLIREAKTHQIYSAMETGGDQGMQTMDRALAVLSRRGMVSHEEALLRAVDADNFKRWLAAL